MDARATATPPGPRGSAARTVVDLLRLRRDAPGSLVVLADGRYALCGPVLVVGARRRSTDWIERRMRVAGEAERAWLRTALGAVVDRRGRDAAGHRGLTDWTGMARLADDELHEFYEQCYTPGADGDKHRRWRELGAEGKADHVVDLVARAGLPAPRTVCEVGCGDGAVLGVLGRRGFGGGARRLRISASGVRLAAEREEVTEARVFDGAHLPVADDAYDLVFATHVLEHVPDPAPLARELLRAGRAVVVEVPLEANLSARRPAARAASEGVGHLHRFDRRAIRALVAGAGGRGRRRARRPAAARGPRLLRARRRGPGQGHGQVGAARGVRPPSRPWASGSSRCTTPCSRCRPGDARGAARPPALRPARAPARTVGCGT